MNEAHSHLDPDTVRPDLGLVEFENLTQRQDQDRGGD